MSKGVLVTEENVNRACQELSDSGLKVSNRAVIAKLGGGSPNAVTPLVKAWKESHEKVTVAKQLEIDKAVLDALSSQIERVAADSASTANEKLAEALDNLALFEESSRQFEKELGVVLATVDELHAEAERGFSLSERQAEEISSLKADKAKLESALAEASSKVTKVETILEAERDKNASLKTQLEQTQYELKEQTKRATDLEKQASTASAKVSTLESALADKTTQIAEIKDELKQFKADAKIEQNSAKEDVKKAEKAASDAFSEKAKIEGKLESLEAHSGALAQKVNLLLSEIDALKKQQESTSAPKK